MKTDQQLHIIISAALVLASDVKTTLVIGALCEINDHKEYNTPISHCCKDMMSNIIGAGIGLLIKKIIK